MSDLSYIAHRPEGPLRRFVREMLWIRSERPRVQVLLPETTLTLMFRQSGAASLGDATLPNAVVSGLQGRIRTVAHAAGSSVLIVRFTEAGSSGILHDRADLLYNQTAPLDALLPRRAIDRVQNILSDAGDAPRMFLALEQFLRGRIRESSDISPQIEEAVRIIRYTDGRSPIRTVARRAAMSESALERHFRVAVGTSPKRLSRLARLQHVCRLWDAGKNLTQIAFEAGYTDQPHLVRDFRQFTGVSPERFFLQGAPRNLPVFYK